MTKARSTIPSQVDNSTPKDSGGDDKAKGTRRQRPPSFLAVTEALKRLRSPLGAASFERRLEALVFLRLLLTLPGPVFLAFSIQQYVGGVGSFGSVAQGLFGFTFAVALAFATVPVWLFSLLLAQIQHMVHLNKPESLHGRPVWTRLRAFEAALFWLTAIANVLLYSQDRVYFAISLLFLQPFWALALYTSTNIVRAIINHQGSSYHSFLLSQGWRVFVNAIFCVCVMLYGLSAMSRIPIDALSYGPFSELSFSGIACSDEGAFLNAFGASGANASCPAKPHCGYRTYEDLCQAVQYSTMARGLSIDLMVITLFVFASWLVVSLHLLGTGRLRANNGYSNLFSRHMIVAMLLGLVQLMSMIFSCMRLLLIVPRLQSPRQAAYFERVDSMAEELPLFCYSNDCIFYQLWGTVCLDGLIAVALNFDLLKKIASKLSGSDQAEEELKLAKEELMKTWEKHAPFFYFLPAKYVRETNGPENVRNGNEKPPSLPRMQTLRDAGILQKMKIPLKNAFRGEGIIKKILFVSHRWEEPHQPDVNGDQLKAIKAYLEKHPEIEWVWFDYSSMPQKIEDGTDCRKPMEKAEFELMLSLIVDLYLTAHVLILLDSSYASRFWTLTEAWCSMQTATPEGLSISQMSHAEGLGASDATELRTPHAHAGPERYTIACIHNASDAHGEALRQLLATKTPSQMVQVLMRQDVFLTNQKDKKAMLPKIQEMDEHVKKTFKELELTEVLADTTQVQSEPFVNDARAPATCMSS